MTDIQRLLRLRAVTTRLREVPGMVLLLDWVRRHYRSHAGPVLVHDFEGSIRIEVRLDEHMGSQIFWYGSYSREVLRVLGRLLTPGMIVVDAGANIGEISLLAARMVQPEGMVFSFEPVPELASRLRRNASLNRFSGIEVIECGLGEQARQAEMYRPDAPFQDGTLHAGLATLYANADRAESVGKISLTTLDAFVHARGLPRIDLLKVDVEGAELPLLRGAAAVLRDFRPWLILEVQEETSRAAGYTQQEILTYLEGFGYRFVRLGRRGRIEPLTVTTLEAFQNVVAIPTGRTL
ncbi:MAG: FkbM family methyltransferase [Gemmatimonadales bacterium]|nr:MAG: FkbM family methyltransferase [Gemmatimonadales bacterium]